MLSPVQSWGGHQQESERKASKRDKTGKYMRGAHRQSSKCQQAEGLNTAELAQDAEDSQER